MGNWEFGSLEKVVVVGGSLFVFCGDSFVLVVF